MEEIYADAVSANASVTAWVARGATEHIRWL
jgi:hypothetical protein